jgi:hypothetical protein
MKNLGALLLAVCLGMTAGLAYAQVAAAAKKSTPVNQCGQVLSTPGEYVLSPGVSCGCTPIMITSSNVHLNTAKNGVTTTCDVVVLGDGLSNIRIDGGGSFTGGGGLVIGADDHVMVSGITLMGESDLGGSTNGVVLGDTSGGANHVTIENSKITGVTGIVGTASNSVFKNNTINGGTSNIGNGINVAGTGNKIEGNTLSADNAGVFPGGIGILVPSKNQVSDNKVNQFGIGIEVSGNSNSISKNTVTGISSMVPDPSQRGIETLVGAEKNTIERNTVSGNTTDLFESNGPPCVNTWRHNTFGTSGGAMACIH